jgi:glycerate 2-kinase
VIIKNEAALATSSSRAQALAIVEAGIGRVLPGAIMTASLDYDSSRDLLAVDGQALDLSRGRVFVVGGGKAAAAMARALEGILGSSRITAGLVTAKYGDGERGCGTVETVRAGHPVPDLNGVAAVRRMLDLKWRFAIGQYDTVVCLLSGGGSALLPCPVDDITLVEKQTVTELLLSSGADIAEINRVRKHLSRIKGGQLGHFFVPARVVSLILSDVVGNDLSVIASGPTYPDPSTFGEALTVLEKYDIVEACPAGVLEYLKRGLRGAVPETPKSLGNCRNSIIGDIGLALEAMKNRAIGLGLRPVVVTGAQIGDTGAVARLRAQEIRSDAYAGFNAVLVGGETTPRLPDDRGRGGRNQHYAAVSMSEMMDYPGSWVLASVGTDGSDFLPDVAGAIVDDATAPWLAARNVDVQGYLERYDSYGLLLQTGNSLVETGSTGTNVGDVMVYILG